MPRAAQTITTKAPKVNKRRNRIFFVTSNTAATQHVFQLILCRGTVQVNEMTTRSHNIFQRADRQAHFRVESVKSAERAEGNLIEIQNDPKSIILDLIQMSKNRQAAIKHKDITLHRVGAIQFFSVESQNAFYIFFFFEFKNFETFKSKWKLKLKKVETLWHWWSDFILPLYNFAHFRSCWNAWLSGKWVVQKKYDSEIRLDHNFFHHFGFDLF